MYSLAASSAPSVVTQMTGSGLIGIREGLEAGIVVMVLVAFAAKAGRRDALKWIALGAGGGLALMIGTFLVIHFGTSTISGVAAELIAGLASLVAVLIVTGMVLWMRQASAHMSGDLKSGMSAALTAGGGAVAGLAFLAVGREGFETALLMVGYAESVAGGVWPLVGLLLGVVVAAALSYLLFKGAIHIDFNRFFFYTGLFLIVVAAGILAYGLRALQVADWIPGLGSTAFDITSWYDPGSWYAAILQGVFNFRADPTWVQVIAWLAYVVVVGGLFIALGRPAPKKAVATAKTPAAADRTADAALTDATSDSGRQEP